MGLEGLRDPGPPFLKGPSSISRHDGRALSQVARYPPSMRDGASAPTYPTVLAVHPRRAALIEILRGLLRREGREYDEQLLVAAGGGASASTPRPPKNAAAKRRVPLGATRSSGATGAGKTTPPLRRPRPRLRREGPRRRSGPAGLPPGPPPRGGEGSAALSGGAGGGGGRTPPPSGSSQALPRAP